MTEKKRALVLMVGIALILAILNVLMFSSKLSASGMAVTEINEVGSFLLKFDLPQIAFVLQWVFILAILIFAFAKYAKNEKLEKELPLIHLKKKEVYSTDLDSLLTLLKERKTLKIKEIVKIFKIDKEKAMEWCKILEDYNLAELNYPAFSDPEVALKEAEK